MKIQEVVSKNYIFDYEGKTKNSLLSLIHLNKEKTEILQYSQVEVKGYVNTISLKKDGTINVKFGCLNLSQDDILNGYKQIMGENTGLKRFGLRKGKNGKVLTTNIIEESKNYYISSSSKAYPKSEYIPAEYNYNPKVVEYREKAYWSGDIGWSVRGHKLGTGDAIKQEIINIFKYYISIIEFLKERNELQTK